MPGASTHAINQFSCPHNKKESSMSRFEKLSHVIWHCQYHIVWVPKYRYRILTGAVANEVYRCIQIYCGRLNCEIVELNVQPDHVHLLVKVPPKRSISEVLGAVKGRTAIRIFKQFPKLRKKPYWGNSFWAKGYGVDTVGMDAEMVRKYVKYQEKLEKQQEQLQF